MQPLVTVDEENLITDLRSQGLNKDRIAIAVYGSRSAGNVAKVSWVVDEAPDEDEGETTDEDESLDVTAGREVEEIDRFCAHCGKYITGNYLTRQKSITYDLGRDGLKTYYPVPNETVFLHARCLTTKNVNQYPPVGNYPPVPPDPTEVMRLNAGKSIPHKDRKLSPEEIEEYYRRLEEVEGTEVVELTKRAREQYIADGGYEGREAARIEAEARRLEAQEARKRMGKQVVYRSGDAKWGNLCTVTRNYATGIETVSQQRGGQTTKYNQPISKTVPTPIGVKTVPTRPKRKGIRGKLGI